VKETEVVPYWRDFILITFSTLFRHAYISASPLLNILNICAKGKISQQSLNDLFFQAITLTGYRFRRLAMKRNACTTSF